MNIKVGDRVRFKADIYRVLGLRGGRETAVVQSIDPFNDRCILDGDGLHQFLNVNLCNVEKVESKKSTRKEMS